MSTHILLQPEGFLEEVRPVVEEVLEECEEMLTPKKKFDVNISFTDDEFVKEELGGSMGWTRDDDFMNIEVNTSVPDWEEGVLATVSHEFNHLVRMQETGMRDEDVTLLDQVVLDGLAQCFEEEITGETPPYAQAISQDQAQNVWNRIESDLSRKDFSFEEIFFGGNDDFPHWAGYTLSYMLVKERIDELDAVWQELIEMESEELVDESSLFK